MTRLENALKHSTLGAAYCDTPDNNRVLVERKTQARHPGEPVRYLVRVLSGTESFAETSGYDAPDLETAVALTRTLDLEGFDPSTADWRPADESTRTSSAKAPYEQLAGSFDGASGYDGDHDQGSPL
jgi:hypothetical protein